MTKIEFKAEILEGIPDVLPAPQPYDHLINHAPDRRQVLNPAEKKLAVRNALRYFKPEHHRILAQEFMKELEQFGRIYMYRFRPSCEIKARSISEYPCHSIQAASIMMMIQNNLDPSVAQHPHELITYGGNGAVFQNWAQYRLTMKYLAEMTNKQTLVIYSGHPLGLFPSHPDAPRMVITNGMMVPNYSSKDDYERYNALGVTQYGQMTAGSYMYIGPQGIVHGTSITLLNASRIHGGGNNKCNIFISSGLGGMSGAQPKAAVIAGLIGVIAEINPKALAVRKNQGWVDEVFSDLNGLIRRIISAKQNKEIISIAYHGNVVDLWERLASDCIDVDLGSDQTSLHNPFSGGYYPVSLSMEDSNKMMVRNPQLFRRKVRESLCRQVTAINRLADKGMYFFDYGNAFLLESERAGAEITIFPGKFRYPSYVQDIMGPLFFDYGFGPFRWVCTSGLESDLEKTDQIAAEIIERLCQESPLETRKQMEDNLHWIREAGKNNLVVGSKARILYADCTGRIRIAEGFNNAIREGKITGPVVIGRDHHDVSGTDSPFRETSNIFDGSAYTADMAVQNFAGDSFRGATWVSLHNGGGVGWGEAINGGFGLTLDGSPESDRRLKMMLYWDVNNGISRRSWAGNKSAQYAVKKAMDWNPDLKVTLPEQADNELLEYLFSK